MKVLMINVVCGIRSTGRICTDLAIALEKQGLTNTNKVRSSDKMDSKWTQGNLK